MRTPAVTIQRKRDGEELKPKEIRDFIHGLATGDVADYQASAFLMAVWFRGMSLDETVALTQAMLESGERYDFTSIAGPMVDKHSTGGVGDKVSLILAPLAAACGLRVPMMAGRGLGHTGGTLDKLEAIPGFDTRLPRDRVERVLRDVGCVMMGQTDRIVPADRKLYALRDVTSTIDCAPLITASILSKKLAEGTRGLVMDVKVGSGAFMRTASEARKLAGLIVRVARKMGLPCRAVLTDMSQPLGYAAGNALEVAECIEVLTRHEKGDQASRQARRDSEMESGPCSADLKELSVQLCAHMLQVGGVVKTLPEGRRLAYAKLADGGAWERFRKLVAAQGGDVRVVDDPARLPRAAATLQWKARRKGYVARMDTREIGRILVELGAGRRRAEDGVDPGVGLVFHRKLGARVAAGEVLATVHAPASPKSALAELESRFHEAVEITGARKTVPKLILETVG